MINLGGKTVLVTGGTGSFGKAFVKRLLALPIHALYPALDKGPKKVIVFSRDELKQYEMANEIKDDRLRFFLGDVRDRDRLYRAFDLVDIVVHAAALKQVPAGEYNPEEFIKTNVMGAVNVVNAAVDRNVGRVVALSTDKASSPVTAYGTSKAMMEHVFRAGQSYVRDKATKLACVRYGNVAGSRGSIIPTWKGIIRGGATTVPLTDDRMTRFFFKLEDAVDLVLWVLDNMRGGELFVPKMPSFYVTDLAKAFGVGYHTVGIRQTEKLAETMISADEAPYFKDLGPLFVRCNYVSGSLLPDGFVYGSDNNPEWLSVEQLQEFVGE